MGKTISIGDFVLRDKPAVFGNAYLHFWMSRLRCTQVSGYAKVLNRDKFLTITHSKLSSWKIEVPNQQWLCKILNRPWTVRINPVSIRCLSHLARWMRVFICLHLQTNPWLTLSIGSSLRAIRISYGCFSSSQTYFKHINLKTKCYLFFIYFWYTRQSKSIRTHWWKKKLLLQ